MVSMLEHILFSIRFDVEKWIEKKKICTRQPKSSGWRRNYINVYEHFNRVYSIISNNWCMFMVFFGCHSQHSYYSLMFKNIFFTFHTKLTLSHSLCELEAVYGNRRTDERSLRIASNLTFAKQLCWIRCNFGSKLC